MSLSILSLVDAKNSFKLVAAIITAVFHYNKVFSLFNPKCARPLLAVAMVTAKIPNAQLAVLLRQARNAPIFSRHSPVGRSDANILNFLVYLLPRTLLLLVLFIA